MRKQTTGPQDHSNGTDKGRKSGSQNLSQTRTGQKIVSLRKPISFTIMGRPALKKNSRDIGFAGKKFIPLQSKSYRLALKEQLPQIKSAWKLKGAVGSKDQLLHVKSIFYAGKGVEPDLDGALVGLWDLLQKAGVVSNDRWIKSADGSRVIAWSVHKGEPRTEVRIEEER